MTLLPSPTLSERAAWVVDVSTGNEELLEVPRAVKTNYLTHGLFRYAGKLPPPLVAHLLDAYTTTGDVVLDPMCGGGTTAIEAVTSGRPSISLDINPVSLLVTDALTHAVDLGRLARFGAEVLDGHEAVAPPGELESFFSTDAYGLIHRGLSIARMPVEKTLMLSIARRASYANTKKINTVVDATKTPRPVRELFTQTLQSFLRAFEELNGELGAESCVKRCQSQKLSLDDESVDFAFLHPPYLTNTAFSESMHLQLLLLGHDPEVLRKKELAFRGSYFYVQNGLRKYLVGWSRTLGETFRVLKPGGRLVVVVGDGRIDRVRIPVATITQEFAADLGFEHVRRARHLLNNQTGWTLSRRMSSQHVLVFQKP